MAGYWDRLSRFGPVRSKSETNPLYFWSEFDTGLLGAVKKKDWTKKDWTADRSGSITLNKQLCQIPKPQGESKDPTTVRKVGWVSGLLIWSGSKVTH